MTQEAPSLFPGPIEQKAPPGRGKHGYYRKPNGWIGVGSTTAANRSGYEYKGYTFLPLYGEFANGTAGGEPREQDTRGMGWNPADEPWRQIFQLNGAKEFCVDQIIAYRWHLRPPYREVTFPQLEGIEITNYPCPECEKGIFSAVNAKEAAEQLRSHLTSGVNQRHNYSANDLRELGKEFDIDFDSARVGRINQYRSQQPELSPEAPPVLTPNEDVVCECGWAAREDSKNKLASLQTHKNLHCELREAVPA